MFNLNCQPIKPFIEKIQMRDREIKNNNIKLKPIENDTFIRKNIRNEQG